MNELGIKRAFSEENVGFVVTQTRVSIPEVATQIWANYLAFLSLKYHQ